MVEVVASAPGKFIVLGEHAVVFGKPAVALAIDRRFTVAVSDSDTLRVNGKPTEKEYHPHIRTIMERNECGPISIDTDSEIPSGSGLGSSAALSAALSIATRKLCGKPIDKKLIAEDAFEAEWTAQGRASPMDASACTQGGGIILNRGRGPLLWNITKGNNSWDVYNTPTPRMTFVIGYTGIKAPTGPLVEKVRKYRDKNRFASDIVDEIGNITEDGIDMLAKNDVVGLGKLMTQNHKLLSILGVSCNELNSLVNASNRYSYGAKLTGSGGGGCMVALTDQPEKVCETIAVHGGFPFIVNTDLDGVLLTEIE